MGSMLYSSSYEFIHWLYLIARHCGGLRFSPRLKSQSRLDERRVLLFGAEALSNFDSFWRTLHRLRMEVAEDAMKAWAELRRTISTGSQAKQEWTAQELFDWVGSLKLAEEDPLKAELMLTLTRLDTQSEADHALQMMDILLSGRLLYGSRSA